MTTQWSRPWAEVELGGRRYPLKRFEGEEALSQPFWYWIYAVVADYDELPDGDSIVARDAVVRWGNGDWGSREAAGVVSWFRDGDCEQTGRVYFEARIEPRLSALGVGASTRLYTRVALEEVSRRLLASAGYDRTAVDWAVRETLPVRRQLLQAAESDRAFLERQWARSGVAYGWHSGAVERLFFAADSAEYPAHEGAVTLSPREHPEPGGYGLDWFRVGTWLSARPEPVRARHLREDAARLERVRGERAAAARYRLRAAGPQADLAAGQRVELRGLAGARDGRLSERDGWHLVTRAHHSLNIDDRDGGERVPGGYRVTIEALPEMVGTEAVHFRPPEPAPVERPLVMSARVQPLGGHDREAVAGGGARVTLGEAQASEPLMRVTPFNGRGSGGWYTPLLEGNRVLVSCFNHDPDLPVIVGVLPVAGNGQPASSSAGRDGAYRSAAGQGLSVEGAGARAPEGTRLTLHGPGMDSALQLDVGAHRDENLVRLACEKGALTLESGDELREQSGGSRWEETGGSEQVRVVEGAVRGRAEARTALRCRETMSLSGRAGVSEQAGGTLQVRAGGGMHLEGRAGLRIHVKEGDGLWRTVSGGLSLRAGQNVRLHSRSGTLTVTNGARSAGLSVGDGALKLWGERIEVATDELTFSGDVEQADGGPEPAEPVAVEPVENKAPERASGEGLARVHSLHWCESATPGETILARFMAERLEGPTDAVIKVYGLNSDGEPDESPVLEREVSIDNGHNAVELVMPEGGGECGSSDSEGDEPFGLELVFEVEVS